MIKDKNNKNLIIILACLIVLVIILLFTNSNKKTLTCKSNISDETGSYNTVYKATFKNDKLNKLEVSYKNTPTDEFMSMLDDIYENYNNQLISLKNNGGYTFKIKKGDDYVLFESKINIKRIPDSTKELLGFNENWTYDEFKKDLEANKDENFKCE